MVRHWTLTPAFQGSNPCSPAKNDLGEAVFYFMELFDTKLVIQLRIFMFYLFYRDKRAYLHSIKVLFRQNQLSNNLMDNKNQTIFRKIIS